MKIKFYRRNFTVDKKHLYLYNRECVGTGNNNICDCKN